MTAATLHTVAGIPVLAAEATCTGCGRDLVLVQLPGTRLTQADAVCMACVPTKRLREAA